MSFEISVVSNTPLTPLTDLDEVLSIFLSQIGYLPAGYTPRNDATDVENSIPFKIFRDYFLRRSDRAWLIEEISADLEATKATVYRHVNKLKGLDILEEVYVERDGQRKKGYRIRYGNISKAWNFTESNVQAAMDSYRKTVDHIQSIVEAER
ncbi:MAG: helix-turn-helix domain-containing protein [Thermoplasmata archaeon]|uniref:Helix-turn-helix domain-containing protein n=1 Tax=Candidatus Sysuiplasma superficiale TaxID=2823368 RepID=A0A8J7YQJ3_9ARCH|nr:helix-turn-helix transcriptional regulator [Candidatus Sysuiplasma superficiale]MBX8645074.1 helix-turn-helix domain-containing protein [Candidatus Sysuiplasma superficiale]MCL4346546.1 helix-turn-helix domain-containing protein [Candidatus Thermoplasmatota archaeon]